MTTLYCFGNPFLKEDSLAVVIGRKLRGRGHKVQICRSPDELFGEKDILILDVVKGIKEPITITDPQQLKQPNITTLHDFDLATMIKILKELGELQSIKILGLPMDYLEEKAVVWVEGELKTS